MRKRANGTGSVQQRGERFIAAITLPGDVQGRQKRLTRSFKRQEAAQQWLEDQRRTPDALEVVEMQLPPDLSASCTYSTFLDVWLEVRQPRVREKTWLEYERLIRLHLKPSTLASLPPHRISALHVERFLLDLYNTGSTPSLAFMALRLVKLTLGHAVDWRLLTFHPRREATYTLAELLNP